MSKIKCYTPEGKMEMKEPVDVSECVENCGYTRERVAKKETPVKKEAASSTEKTLDKMNKTELTAEAESLDIELDGSETKAVIISKIDAKLEED